MYKCTSEIARPNNSPNFFLKSVAKLKDTIKGVSLNNTCNVKLAMKLAQNIAIFYSLH